MPRRKRTRIYVRNQGGEARYYGDFRDYSDVGGKREALIPPEASSATADPDVAKKLAGERLRDLELRRRNRDLLGIKRESTLAAYAAHHLREKKKSGKVVDGTLVTTEGHLRAAIDFFGAQRDLRAIDAPKVGGFIQHLAQQPNGRGQRCPECDAKPAQTQCADDEDDPLLWICPVCVQQGRGEVTWQVGSLSASTQRKYINSLSNLYRRAQSEGYVEPGFNPVAALMDKPTDPISSKTDFLEVPDAALLLEAARTVDPEPSADAFPYVYELLATYLLTGGRKSEVLGLEVEDISFDRKTVTFRTNRWRRLKTAKANRVVPLWPQLEEILRPYVFDGPGPRGSLLFASHRAGDEQMLDNISKSLRAISGRAGLDGVHLHQLRHTYCSARLQTLDRGHPVSPFTVAQEMGHGGRSLVDRVYGHLGEVRHRAEVVEYRVEQHQQQLGERLAALKALWSGVRAE